MREYLNTDNTPSKNKAERSNETDYESNESIRVYRKKKKTPNKNQGQENIANYHKIQRFCVLRKKPGYPECRYEYIIDEKYRGFESNKNLGGGLAKCDTATNYLINYSKNLKKDKKAIKNQSNIIYSTTNMTSSSWKLRKAKKITTEKYDTSNSDSSSSSESYSTLLDDSE